MAQAAPVGSVWLWQGRGVTGLQTPGQELQGANFPQAGGNYIWLMRPVMPAIPT